MSQPCTLNVDLASRYGKWLVAQKYAASQYSLAVQEYAKFLRNKPLTRSTHIDVQEFIAQSAANIIRAGHTTDNSLMTTKSFGALSVASYERKYR